MLKMFSFYKGANNSDMRLYSRGVYDDSYIFRKAFAREALNHFGAPKDIEKFISGEIDQIEFTDFKGFMPEVGYICITLYEEEMDYLDREKDRITEMFEEAEVEKYRIGE